MQRRLSGNTSQGGIYSTKELRVRQPGRNEFRPTSYFPIGAHVAGRVAEWLQQLIDNQGKEC